MELNSRPGDIPGGRRVVAALDGCAGWLRWMHRFQKCRCRQQWQSSKLLRALIFLSCCLPPLPTPATQKSPLYWSESLDGWKKTEKIKKNHHFSGPLNHPHTDKRDLSQNVFGLMCTDVNHFVFNLVSGCNLIAQPQPNLLLNCNLD